jgi:hypothetical protein
MHHGRSHTVVQVSDENEVRVKLGMTSLLIRCSLGTLLREV